MNFLLTPHNWLQNNASGAGIAGGEVYLSNLCTELLKRGNNIKCIADTPQPYELNGIEVYPQGEPHKMFTNNRDLIDWCDVIICQLIGTAYGYNIAFQFRKPLIFIAHNNSTAYPIKYSPREMLHVVYNCNNTRIDLNNTLGHYRGIVLHPVVQKYQQGKKANKVTLINLSYNKGGHILCDLAKRLPKVQFLGVHGGYQEQITADLPNVTYLPNGTDMGHVYAQTKLLLAPSEFESYSQVCAEAISAGIPVITNNIPGIQENLSYAGVYIQRERQSDDGYKNYIELLADKVLYLIENKEAYKHQSELCLKRAAECEQQLAGEMDNFEVFLKGIKKWEVSYQ